MKTALLLIVASLAWLCMFVVRRVFPAPLRLDTSLLAEGERLSIEGEELSYAGDQYIVLGRLTKEPLQLGVVIRGIAHSAEIPASLRGVLRIDPKGKCVVTAQGVIPLMSVKE